MKRSFFLPPAHLRHRLYNSRASSAWCFSLCFRPWTHTSDDSYIYQLSLDLATATVSSHGSDGCAGPALTSVGYSRAQAVL